MENGVDVSGLGTCSFEPSCTAVCLSGGEEHLWASQLLCWSQAWCSWGDTGRTELSLAWDPGGTKWFEATFSCIFLCCSLTLLWAKDMKGEEKKSWRCLISSVLWSQENKNSLFNSDYSAIVYFCFCMYYTAYKVLKIFACFFLLDIAKEDTVKSQWTHAATLTHCFCWDLSNTCSNHGMPILLYIQPVAYSGITFMCRQAMTRLQC